MNATNTLSVKATSKKTIIKRLADTTTIQCIAEVFSVIMEEPVTGEQTVCLLNAALAVILFFFTAGIGMVVRLLFFCYLAVSLYHCKQYGMDKE